jgi:hypothetical protein
MEADMFEQEIKIYEFTQFLALRMAEGLADERLAEQPLPGMNHGAWLFGHLALTADFVNMFVKSQAPAVAPAGWMELFGRGTHPLPERERYPSLETLVAVLRKNSSALPVMLASATPAWLKEPTSLEGFRRMGLSTNRDVLGGLITAHHGFHTGQLSAWRRAMGYPSVLG